MGGFDWHRQELTVHSDITGKAFESAQYSDNVTIPLEAHSMGSAMSLTVPMLMRITGCAKGFDFVKLDIEGSEKELLLSPSYAYIPMPFAFTFIPLFVGLSYSTLHARFYMSFLSDIHLLKCFKVEDGNATYNTHIVCMMILLFVFYIICICMGCESLLYSILQLR